MKASLYGAGAEYALHSLLTLATRSQPVSVRDLAEYQQIPERFLAQVFTRLVKGGLVTAREGITGGYVLARSASSITVNDVLEAVDSERLLFSCAEVRRKCVLYGAEPPAWSTNGMCRIHLFMTEAEEALRVFLRSKTLADLCGELEQKAPQEFIAASEVWFHQRRTGRIARRKKL